MIIIKKIIKKILIVAGVFKLIYDWKNEKKLQKRIKEFLKNGELPYVNEAPDKYAVGYEPTIRCNLKCKMCYQGQTRALRRSELDKEQVLSVFEKLKAKTKEIKIVGGEPLIRDDIFDLVRFWDKEGRRIILQTNLTLLDEKKSSNLKELKKISDILTSLDGPKEMHDMVRGVPGTFNRLKKSIEIIKKERPDIPITVFATLLIDDNLDSFFRLIDTCKELGIGTINILFEQVYAKEEISAARNIFKEFFGWKEDEYRLNTQERNPVFKNRISPEELKNKLRKIRFYGLKKNCFVNFVPFNYYNNLDKYLGIKKTRAFCHKLLAPELRINQTGDVIWCDVIEKSFGNLLDKKPDEIWLSPEYQKFRQYLFEKGLPICYRCCKAHYVK